MSRPDGQMKINATHELKEWFKRQAVTNKRSLNSEILYHLEQIRNKEEKQRHAR
ncbi:MAG TPA: hypothetical protein DCQ84_09540 [Candidatus Competibacteraceae bacterium]|nr:hypothetical protein [Candidatus Competibacteraceae bacterium]